jgi:hypothetical protein
MLANRRIFLTVAMITLSGILSAGPRLLTAQTQIQGDACKFKTRWKDTHGQCPSCCDSIQYSCPCTI